MPTIQMLLSPAAGKRLIATALASREDVLTALREHTVVIVAGSTNSYLAEQLLRSIGEEGFEPRGFYRGLLRGKELAQSVKPRDEDIVIHKGVWQKGQTVYDAAPGLGKDDIIFKGANAVHLPTGTAGVLIGNPTSGTMAPITAAVIGRRVRLFHPVGVEKRVETPVPELAALCNAPEGGGFRLYPSAGEPYTELDALRDLCGVSARIISGGGVAGYEGCVLLLCEGSRETVGKCGKLSQMLSKTPRYQI
ncbi:MAG: hypothetical protein K2M42_00930 [Oscillospiraceae bacterium]|nr:hypothetical protein [Oscillospiraceae bacterium]